VGFDIEREPVAAKQQFAYVPTRFHPYDVLTVTEHLHFIALAYRVADAEAKYDAMFEDSKQIHLLSSHSIGVVFRLRIRHAIRPAR